MSLPPSERSFRPCVGIVLLNREGAVFVGQRADRTLPAWQLPQGGIDAGETPEVAVFREMKEEIGTANARILKESQNWLSYDFPADVANLRWEGRFRGQTQKWFALQFLGKDQDIDIETKHPEFSEWKWVSLIDIPTLVVPFKREIYQKVVDEFLPLVAQQNNV